MTLKNQHIALSKTIAKLPPSATLAINELSQQLINRGRTIYRLGFGQSPFLVPDSVVAALKEHAHQKDYLPVKGLYALREAVAGFNFRTLGLNYTAADIIIGPGSKELIFAAQMAFDGLVLLPSPSWVSYAPQAIIARRKSVWINTTANNKWNITPSSLAAICKKHINSPKLLILNYPNNPTGGSYTSKELAALAKVARRYNLLIISDEIYAETHHQNKHYSIANFYPEGTIVSSGLSKWCGAGGWRLGTFSFPENYHWLLDAMAVIASETFTSVSAPIQYAAITAFKGSTAIDNYTKKTRIILEHIAQYIYTELQKLHIEVIAPVGGFYLFPNFIYYQTKLTQKGITTSTALCQILLEETGIALLPGTAFGRPPTELSARLSYVDFDGKVCLDIPMNKIKSRLNQSYYPKIVQAMQQLKQWLSQL